MIGAYVGPYEVVEPLGAGGMGRVYRARDPRLGREVALKVLPPARALDALHRARFEREARILASLNHPNIATLYGVEDSPAGQVLVMELVDGHTLADSLGLRTTPRDGPWLGEVLSIAAQLASALEAAHAHGIVHRDLKPANIAVRRDGTVKVLDFGLALAADQTTSDSSDTTLTLTEKGALRGAGTPAYMSPEQVRGIRADARTDIWAFGCVLYELLTGRRAFDGDRPSDVAARILERQPDLSVLPSDTPRALSRLLRRCLEKDPRHRLRDIADAQLELRDARTPDVDGPADEVAARHRSRRWFIASALLVPSAVGAVLLPEWFTREADAPEPVRRFPVTLPPGVSVTRGPGFGSSVALSPDGRTLVIAGSSGEEQQLFRRSLDSFEAVPIAGTERGSSPIFSWDGEWVAFVADGRLKRVPLRGGAAVDIAEFVLPHAGGSWGPEDEIVYSYGGGGELHLASARGGGAERLQGAQPGYYPDALPDGRTVLFVSGGQVHALDRRTSRRTSLRAGTSPRYAMGHVIVSVRDALLAAPMDPERLELTGASVPVVDGVAGDPSPQGGMRHYAVSRNGTLAYVPAADAYDLVLVGADGTERTLQARQFRIENPQFSPDGGSVVAAVRRRAGEPAELWTNDIAAGAATQLTSGGGRAPIWTSPDTITYSRWEAGGGIYEIQADGRGEPKEIVPLKAFHWLVGRTADRGTLVYGRMEDTPSSILVFANGQSHRIIGPSSTWGGRLSRDGRWLVYYAGDGGSLEVFVTSFPEPGRHWRITEGTDPQWNDDRTEVFYRRGSRLMAARLDWTSGVRVVGTRTVVEPFLPPLYDDYNIHPDGRTLVLVRPSGSSQPREVRVVENWVAEVQALEQAGDSR